MNQMLIIIIIILYYDSGKSKSIKSLHFEKIVDNI